MSKLSIKEAEANFKGNKAFIRTQNGTDIISATYISRLYVVEMDKPQPIALTTQSKQKPTSFAIWHKCLAHAGVEIIHQMMTENLVDGLNVCGESSISGLYKDCIYGKHTAHPYNDNKSREKEIFECVHIDIWGPCQVQSTSGALYFIVIMNGFSLYQTVAFLKSKSAEVTLNIFKSFHTEAEHQTGKRLKRVRLDIEREWYNSIWKHYRDKKGLHFEFTMLYTHQQNGMAECSMRTILNGTQTTMAESGLSVKY